MIQLGKFQDLYIVKKKEFGVYVNDQKDVTDGSILLPAKQVPDGARIGDQISCFVYKDSEDRPIATVHIPKITGDQRLHEQLDFRHDRGEKVLVLLHALLLATFYDLVDHITCHLEILLEHLGILAF